MLNSPDRLLHVPSDASRVTGADELKVGAIMLFGIKIEVDDAVPPYALRAKCPNGQEVLLEVDDRFIRIVDVSSGVQTGTISSDQEERSTS